MDLKDLKSLIKMVDESNVNEIEIEQDQSKTKGRLRIRISKNNGVAAMTYIPQGQHSPQVLHKLSPLRFNIPFNLKAKKRSKNLKQNGLKTSWIKAILSRSNHPL